MIDVETRSTEIKKLIVMTSFAGPFPDLPSKLYYDFYSHFSRYWWPRGHSHIWPSRVCTADQGMVFRVLSLNQGIQSHFSVLNRVSFWTGGLVKKSVKFADARSV